jgi:hypothetical protein
MAIRMPLLPSPRMLFVRRAMVEGIKGENRVWRLVMLVIIANRVVRRLMGSDVRTVAIERIKPGDTLVLRGVRSRKLPAP